MMQLWWEAAASLFGGLKEALLPMPNLWNHLPLWRTTPQTGLLAARWFSGGTTRKSTRHKRLVPTTWHMVSILMSEYWIFQWSHWSLEIFLWKQNCRTFTLRCGQEWSMMKLNHCHSKHWSWRWEMPRLDNSSPSHSALTTRTSLIWTISNLVFSVRSSQVCLRCLIQTWVTKLRRT